MIRENRLFWFPFAPGDWLSRFSILGLNCEGRGILVTLCCHQWIEGTIPADPDELAAILGVSATNAQLAKILSVFHHKPSQPSRLYYPILEAMREEAIIRSFALAQAGRQGALVTNAKRGHLSTRN